jgi:hypothetical protein
MCFSTRGVNAEKGMEAGDIWPAVVLGCLTGVLYVTAGVVSNRRAMRSGRRFVAAVLGAMSLRIVAALALLASMVLLLPISVPTLMGSFFVTFLAGLFVEIRFFHGRAVTARNALS